MVNVAVMAMSMLMAQGWAEQTLTLLRKVKVSYSTVMSSSKLLDTLPILPGASAVFLCSHECNVHAWCDLWCNDASAKQCILSNLIVMPGYSEPNTDDAINCYTRRQKDLATGAAIEATPAPKRVKENLVDGFYDRWNLGLCYHSSYDEDNHWLLFDFGSQGTFQLVKLILQASGSIDMVRAVRDVEVRTGMAAVNTPGDFSSYEVFGRFTGPASTHGQVVVIKALTPTKARFVSIQKAAKDPPLQVCHIEIY